MAVTRERFEQGLTYDDYKNQMTRNRERLEENEQTVKLADNDVQFFKNLEQPVNVLVLTEDWCGDAIANVPILGRLATESNKLNLRFFLRDQNSDIMQNYLKDGQFESIPVFVFFDQDFNEIGHWIERPAKVSAMQGERLGKLFATDPALQGVTPGTSPAQMSDEARNRMMQFFGEFRGETRDMADQEVVREIRELVASKAA